MDSANSPGPQSGAGVTPEEALRRLVEGNGRFARGSLTNQNGVTERRLALTGYQAPYAALLSCSDSRVPAELVFDQRVGDLFVFRNAGNFVNPAVLGTLEFGYALLGVKLIVVLGHEGCGAVRATYDAIRNGTRLPPNLDVLQKAIERDVEPIVAANGPIEAAVTANAKAQARKMKESQMLAHAIESGDCKVVAAEYDFQTGFVKILE